MRDERSRSRSTVVRIRQRLAVPALMAWPRKRIGWVAGSVIATLAVTFVVLNLMPDERRIEQKIERRYDTGSPEYFRSMGVLLGPPVPAGNRVEAMRRGVRFRLIVPGADHRHRSRAPRFARGLGTVARGRRGDPRIPTDNVPLQGADRRSASCVRGLDELRHALVPAQRRSEPQRLRRRVCRPPDCSV